MSFANKVTKLKDAIESKGGFDKFMPWFHEQVNPGMSVRVTDDGLTITRPAMPSDKKPTLALEDFSIRELYEAVNTSQFPVITSELISKKIMDEYNAYPGIADQLVTPMPSKLQTDRIPGLWLKGKLEDIEEGANYPHAADMEEEYVTITGKKRGLILDITEEMVLFDQTGAVLMRAGRMGRKLATDREKKVLYTIQDATVSGVNYYAWYPGGTRLALYSTTNRSSSTVAGEVVYANSITDALENYTDLNSADALFALMKDSDGDYVNIVPTALLVSRALKLLAENLINQAKVPYLSSASIGYHQDNPYYGKFKVLSSPLVDDVSNNDWYLGDFKRQFVEKVVIPLQVLVRRDKTNDMSWERDILASYKVRHFTQPGAIDHRHVVKSTGGS